MSDKSHAERLRERAVFVRLNIQGGGPAAGFMDDAAGEIERLRAIIDKLLEVGDDLRCYTHGWDWKYGEYWDKELNEAAEAAKEPK